MVDRDCGTARRARRVRRRPADPASRHRGPHPRQAMASGARVDDETHRLVLVTEDEDAGRPLPRRRPLGLEGQPVRRVRRRWTTHVVGGPLRLDRLATKGGSSAGGRLPGVKRFAYRRHDSRCSFPQLHRSARRRRQDDASSRGATDGERSGSEARTALPTQWIDQVRHAEWTVSTILPAVVRCAAARG